MRELNKRIAHIPVPPRMQRLAISPEGYLVPWFVTWFADGKPADYGVGEPDFRVADTAKLVRAIKERRCWVCGDRLGKHLAFVIGPMCAVNRVTSEPPTHRDCAIFSARACPFLSRPRMRRNEKDVPDHPDAPGLAIMRNPGAMCIWITSSFKTFRPHRGGDGIMFQLGEPSGTLWFANGREATRADVEHSIATGLPILQEMAVAEGPEAVAALNHMHRAAMLLLPK